MAKRKQDYKHEPEDTASKQEAPNLPFDEVIKAIMKVPPKHRSSKPTADDRKKPNARR